MVEGNNLAIYPDANGGGGLDPLGHSYGFTARGRTASISSYGISVYPSALHAQRVDRWWHQIAGRGMRNWPVTKPHSPDEWLIAVIGRNTRYATFSAGATYRNLDFSLMMAWTTIAPVGAPARAHDLQRVSALALSFINRLIDRAVSYASSHRHDVLPFLSPVPLVPPARDFTFSTFGTYHESPYVTHDHSQVVYSWSLTPVGFRGHVGITYNVEVAPNVTMARSDNAQDAYQIAYRFQKITHGEMLDLTSMAMDTPGLHAWASSSPYSHCTTSVGGVYRNLVFLGTVVAHDDLDSCQTKGRWAIDLLYNFVLAAQKYAVPTMPSEG